MSLATCFRAFMLSDIVTIKRRMVFLDSRGGSLEPTAHHDRYRLAGSVVLFMAIENLKVRGIADFSKLSKASLYSIGRFREDKRIHFQGMNLTM